MQYTTFVTMKKVYIILILSGILCSYGIYAQQSRYYQRITRIVTDAGDTATMIILRPVYIFPKRTFKSQKESTSLRQTRPPSTDRDLRIYTDSSRRPARTTFKTHGKRTLRGIQACTENFYLQPSQVVDTSHRPRMQPIFLSPYKSLLGRFQGNILANVRCYVRSKSSQGMGTGRQRPHTRRNRRSCRKRPTLNNTKTDPTRIYFSNTTPKNLRHIISNVSFISGCRVNASLYPAMAL